MFEHKYMKYKTKYLHFQNGGTYSFADIKPYIIEIKNIKATLMSRITGFLRAYSDPLLSRNNLPKELQHLFNDFNITKPQIDHTQDSEQESPDHSDVDDPIFAQHSSAIKAPINKVDKYCGMTLILNKERDNTKLLLAGVDNIRSYFIKERPEKYHILSLERTIYEEALNLITNNKLVKTESVDNVTIFTNNNITLNVVENIFDNTDVVNFSNFCNMIFLSHVNIKNFVELFMSSSDTIFIINCHEGKNRSVTYLLCLLLCFRRLFMYYEQTTSSLSTSSASLPRFDYDCKIHSLLNLSDLLVSHSKNDDLNCSCDYKILIKYLQSMRPGVWGSENIAFEYLLYSVIENKCMLDGIISNLENIKQEYGQKFEQSSS